MPHARRINIVATNKIDLSVLLAQPAAVVAKRLLGSTLVREIDGQQARLKIIETEAYDENDAASHSNWGITPRTKVMFGPAGMAYVYFTYGMHHCFNIVTGQVGEGSAVLIRALEPISGGVLLHSNRPGHSGVSLTNGPAKLCQALQIDKKLYGHDLTQAPLWLELAPAVKATAITTTTRIGISQAKNTLWRFYVTGNSYVSKL